MHLRQALQTTANGRSLSAAQEHEMQLLRARLKQLRFAFVAFDKSHECPETIDDLVTVLGHFRTQFKK